jgi:Tfp pilus assembly protein PilF
MPSLDTAIFLLISLVLVRLLVAGLYAFFQVAAAFLLAPKNKIRLFFGSYGDPKGSFSFNIGRVTAYVHLRVFIFPLSLVDFSDGPLVSRNRQIQILLAGPLGLVFMVGMAIVILLMFGNNGELSFIVFGVGIAVLGVISLVDILRSLTAKPEPILWENYGVMMGEGERLGLLFRHGNLAPQVQRVVWHWLKDDFRMVLELAGPMLEGHSAHKDLYGYAIYACLHVGEIEKGISLHHEVTAANDTDPTEMLILSNLQELGREPEKAMEIVESILKRTPGFHFALNQRAWLLLQDGHADAALVDLNRSLRSDPHFATARSNRARVLLRLGELEKAEKDLEIALKLDPLNSLTYETLADLQQKKGEKQQAEVTKATVRLLQGKQVV